MMRPSPETGLSFLAVGFHRANPDDSSVCHLSLAQVVGGELASTEDLVVLPPTGPESVETRFTRQHGITAEEIREDGVSWSVALDRLLTLQHGSPLVTHHVGYGQGAYRASNEAIGITPPEATWYDTLALAKAELDLPDYQLATVAAALQVPEGQPAAMTANIVLTLAQRKTANSLEELWLGIR